MTPCAEDAHNRFHDGVMGHDGECSSTSLFLMLAALSSWQLASSRVFS
jgi:hypothetical protein